MKIPQDFKPELGLFNSYGNDIKKLDEFINFKIDLKKLEKEVSELEKKHGDKNLTTEKDHKEYLKKKEELKQKNMEYEKIINDLEDVLKKYKDYAKNQKRPVLDPKYYDRRNPDYYVESDLVDIEYIESIKDIKSTKGVKDLKTFLKENYYVARTNLFIKLYETVPENLKMLDNVLYHLLDEIVLADQYHTGRTITYKDKMFAGKRFDRLGVAVEKYVKAILYRLEDKTGELEKIEKAIEKYKNLNERLPIVEENIKLKEKIIKQKTPLITGLLNKTVNLVNKVFKTNNPEIVDETLKELKSDLQELNNKKNNLLKELNENKMIIEQGLNSDNVLVKKYIEFLIMSDEKLEELNGLLRNSKNQIYTNNMSM